MRNALPNVDLRCVDGVFQIAVRACVPEMNLPLGIYLIGTKN